MQPKWDESWFGETPPLAVPDRILAIWSDTVLHQAGSPGIRGFGGRLYFYKDTGNDTVEVDGSVTVYVFDSETRDPIHTAPLKKYVVTSDQLASHHSKTSLGHSYSIWVPWDRVGGPNRTLSLVVRFDGREGGTVLGQPLTKQLPGVRSKDSAPSPIRKVSHESTVEVDTESEDTKSSINSLTITLPPNLQRRLIGVGPQSQSPQPARETAVSRPKRAAAESVLPTKSVLPITSLPNHSQVVEGQATSPPSTRSAPSRFPARREPRVQPGRALLRRLPHPAGWPSALPLTPRSGFAPRNDSTTTSRPSSDSPRP